MIQVEDQMPNPKETPGAGEMLSHDHDLMLSLIQLALLILAPCIVVAFPDTSWHFVIGLSCTLGVGSVLSARVFWRLRNNCILRLFAFAIMLLYCGLTAGWLVMGSIGFFRH